MHCLLLLVFLLLTARANIIITPHTTGLDSYIFYENITEHIYCQASIPVPGLTIKRPDGQALTTTGVVEVLEEGIRVVIKFDRIRASDAGDYICKGDLSNPANTINVVLAQATVLSDTPFNMSSQVREQFQTNYALRYPNVTSHVLTEGGIHTFHCPSEAEFVGNPTFTVLTRWFRLGLAVRNDTYHNTYFDGRLVVQTRPEEGEYLCQGFLPLSGYPKLLLMQATLTVVSPPTYPPPQPTNLPIWAIAIIPIGVFLCVFVSLCMLVACLLAWCLRRRTYLSTKPQPVQKLRSAPLFRRSLEINYKRLHIGNKLSEGSYGRFYLAKLDEEQVVVKRFEGEWGDRSTEVERDIMLRIENRKQISSVLGKNNSFVQVLGFVSKRPPYCFVYEEMQGGNLTGFLSQLRRGPAPQWYLGLLTNLWADKYAPRVSDDLVTISWQVSQAMKFLEQKRALHRSLSPSKVLLQVLPKQFIAKISGFSPEGEQAGSDQEKLYYRAPEVINGSPHSPKSEVYSLSLLLLNIVTLGGASAESGARLAQLKKLKVTQPANVADKLFSVFKEGLNQTPSERPSLQQVSDELDKLTADTPASSLIRLRLPEEIVPSKKSWHQWDEAVLLAKPPLLRSTDGTREGYLIDNKPTDADKRGSKEVVLRAKKDLNNIPTRSISAAATQPDVAGVDTNVSLRALRKDKKNIAGLV